MYFSSQISYKTGNDAMQVAKCSKEDWPTTLLKWSTFKIVCVAVFFRDKSLFILVTSLCILNISSGL